MKLAIPYVNEEKTFELEQRNLLYNLVPNFPLETEGMSEKDIITRAIQHPVGSRNIGELAGSGDTVCVLVDDWTRPTPAYRIVPIVMDELLKNGVEAEDIRVIIACGTHSQLTKPQMEAKLSKSIVKRFMVQNHNPTRNLIFLGQSKKGTPVYLNRFFMEADFRMAIGGILAHPVAGYGGGAKIIVPGVAGEKTIDCNHAMADNPRVAIGIVENNPVREDMEDIARMAGLAFTVNVIIDPRREILKAVSGDFVKAHREGVHQYEQIYGVKVEEEADIVVLGASPRDATIYHGTFALPCAVPMAKPGGTIIWVAPCLSGPGTSIDRRGFGEVLSMPPEQLMKSMKKGEVPASGGVFDWCTSKVVHRNKVVLVSEMIPRKEANEFGFHHGETIQKVLDKELKANKDAKVTVVPFGGLAVPVYSKT